MKKKLCNIMSAKASTEEEKWGQGAFSLQRRASRESSIWIVQ
jgi:hypothetical protein